MRRKYFVIAVVAAMSVIFVHSAAAQKPDPVGKPVQQVQEVNVDADGYIAVHEQGIVDVKVLEEVDVNVTGGAIEANILGGAVDAHITGGAVDATVTGGSIDANITGGQVDTNVTNTVEVVATERDLVDNNSDLEETTVVRESDLLVGKADNGLAAIAGNSYVYTVTVDNAGLSDATGVVLTDTLPAFTTLNPAPGLADRFHSKNDIVVGGINGPHGTIQG